MHSPELEVSIALVRMVKLVGIGDLGEEGSGVLGERVEEDSIHDKAKCLYNQSQRPLKIRLRVSRAPLEFNCRWFSKLNDKDPISLT